MDVWLWAYRAMVKKIDGDLPFRTSATGRAALPDPVSFGMDAHPIANRTGTRLKTR